jgi:tetratricopeptide (TPR) repeat protein
MRNKKLFLLAVLLIITGAIFYFWLVKEDNSLPTPEETNEDIFSITPPADFNEYELARFDEKLEDLKEIYEQDKEDVNFWIGLGNLRNFVRDYQGAITAYQKCLEINPLNIVANVNIADVYEKKLEDFAKAEEYYRKAIDNQFNNPDLYNRLGRLYYLKMDRPAEAEETFLEGLQKTDSYPDLLVSLINFYDQQNRTEDKIKYIKILLELYPDNQLYQEKYSELIE